MEITTRLNGKPLQVTSNSSEMMEVWITIFEMFAHESGHKDSIILLYHTSLFQTEEQFSNWCAEKTGAPPPLYWVNRSYDLLQTFWAWVEAKKSPIPIWIDFSAE